MENAEDYRKKVLQAILEKIEPVADILAAWEGGSAATGTKDQYSDIDLCVLAKAPTRSVLDTIESSLQKLQISHTWQPPKPFWGEGLLQRVIVLKEAPKYFSVDVGVFDQAHPPLLKDFLEIERHGQPTVFFDKGHFIQPGHTDPVAWFKRQQARVEELNQGFPIFKTLVLKEIDRGHALDAIAFYQNGLVRPLVEVLGMIHRPFKSDFGMRYIHKTFPKDAQALVEDLNYIAGFHELPAKVLKVDKAFNEAVRQVKSKTSL